MKKDNRIYVKHILESIEKIQRYVSGKSFDDFFEEEMTRDAVARHFTIIGEATKRIETEFRIMHSQIEWKKMAGICDVLIHDYEEVDFERLWDTIEKILPALKSQLTDLLKNL